MRYCAFIQIASLPTMWVVVGCALIVVTIVSVALFLFKWREASLLRKEVFELRDTMRMMRYEEANLARMLHTADKHFEPLEVENENIVPIVEPIIPVKEQPIHQVEMVEDEHVSGSEDECNVEQSVAEEEVVCKETDASAGVSDIPTIAASEETEMFVEAASEDVELVKGAIESSDSSTPIVDLGDNHLSHPYKSPINERRPAIPTDLFSAWFAENEDRDEVTLETENPSGVVAVETSVVADKEEEEVDSQEPIAVDNQSVNATMAQSREDERFCRKLERLVQNRMSNPNLNIDIIASQLGMGRTNFYRKVRELMGVSPNDYLRKCRMDRAAELLRTSEQPISEICAQVGIPDAQYFSRVFKTFYGTTPSVYREQ